MKPRSKGVFCLEGDWWNDLKHPSTVEPLLAILDQDLPPAKRHIYRDVGTVEEFWFYLKKWTQAQFNGHPILYLGFHGDRKVIHVGDGRRPESEVTLDRLEQELWGACRRRIIHFGCCSTLDIHGVRLNTFLKRTGALAVSGYCCEVDWITSTAFELLVLTQLQSGALTVSGANSMKQRIWDSAQGLAQKLQFRMQVRAAGWKTPVRAAAASAV